MLVINIVLLHRADRHTCWALQSELVSDLAHVTKYQYSDWSSLCWANNNLQTVGLSTQASPLLLMKYVVMSNFLIRTFNSQLTEWENSHRASLLSSSHLQLDEDSPCHQSPCCQSVWAGVTRRASNVSSRSSSSSKFLKWEENSLSPSLVRRRQNSGKERTNVCICIKSYLAVTRQLTPQPTPPSGPSRTSPRPPPHCCLVISPQQIHYNQHQPVTKHQTLFWEEARLRRGLERRSETLLRPNLRVSFVRESSLLILTVMTRTPSS